MTLRHHLMLTNSPKTFTKSLFHQVAHFSEVGKKKIEKKYFWTTLVVVLVTVSVTNA